jgi:hypothetical protein
VKVNREREEGRKEERFGKEKRKQRTKGKTNKRKTHQIQ